jgi:hypothetical protein
LVGPTMVQSSPKIQVYPPNGIANRRSFCCLRFPFFQPFHVSKNVFFLAARV